MFGPSLSSLSIARRAKNALFAPPRRLQAAALPWRRTGKGVDVLLVTSRETGRWILPKGWVEVDEAPSAAALREAGEEAGVRGRVDAAELGAYFYEKVPVSGDPFVCEVRVFAVKVTRVLDKWKEKGQRRRQWVGLAAAASMVSEPELAAMISAFPGAPSPSE